MGWLERNMEEVVTSSPAIRVACTVLQIVLSECGQKDNCHTMLLTRWVNRLTEGPEPLVIAAAVNAVGHQLVLQLVTQGQRKVERDRLVTVIRRRQASLRRDIVGCLVLKALEGLM